MSADAASVSFFLLKQVLIYRKLFIDEYKIGNSIFADRVSTT